MATPELKTYYVCGLEADQLVVRSGLLELRTLPLTGHTFVHLPSVAPASLTWSDIAFRELIRVGAFPGRVSLAMLKDVCAAETRAEAVALFIASTETRIRDHEYALTRLRHRLRTARALLCGGAKHDAGGAEQVPVEFCVACQLYLCAPCADAHAADTSCAQKLGRVAPPGADDPGEVAKS